MEFFTTDMAGVTRIDPPAAERLRILKSVAVADDDADFPEVYLSLKSGLVLGYGRAGYLTWEEDGEVTRIAGPVDVDAAAGAWSSAIAGNHAALEQLQWRPIADAEE